ARCEASSSAAVNAVAPRVVRAPTNAMAKTAAHAPSADLLRSIIVGLRAGCLRRNIRTALGSCNTVHPNRVDASTPGLHEDVRSAKTMRRYRRLNRRTSWRERLKKS